MDSTAAMAAVVSKAGAAGRRGAGADDADRQIQTCAHRRGYPEQRKAPMNGICTAIGCACAAAIASIRATTRATLAESRRSITAPMPACAGTKRGGQARCRSAIS
jgi:hypothetical protein